MAFWIYILKCADDSYYTGHTDNLEARLAQHHQGTIRSCYTFDRRPLTLVYAEDSSSRESCLAFEQQIKRWSRAKKEALIARDWPRLQILARCRDFAETVHGSTSSPRTVSEVSLSAPPRTVSAARASKVRTDEEWMRVALGLADRAERDDDEIPVGAVVVAADGRLLGEGWNRNIREHDASAHAEIVALRAAGRAAGNHRLVGCTMYVTLEPCAMCAMAAVHARIERLVFGASDPKTGACGSVFQLVDDPRHNHRVVLTGGVLAAEAGARLRTYFRGKRTASRVL